MMSDPQNKNTSHAKSREIDSIEQGVDVLAIKTPPFTLGSICLQQNYEPMEE